MVRQGREVEKELKMIRPILLNSKWNRNKVVAYLHIDRDTAYVQRLPCCSLGLYFEILSELIDLGYNAK